MNKVIVSTFPTSLAVKNITKRVLTMTVHETKVMTTLPTAVC